MKLRNLSLLIFSFLFLYSCTVDDGSKIVKNDPLKTLLAERSSTGTLEGLIFPNSNALEQIPQDPRNPLNTYKVELGRLLFHETGLAVDAFNPQSMYTYSCASCHHADAGFQSGLKQGIGDGGENFGIRGEMRSRNMDCDINKIDVQPIKSPSVLNSAYQELMLWNGQFGGSDANKGTEHNWSIGTPKAQNHLGYHGLETQAIAGFDVHRLGINEELLQSNTYKTLFKKAFPNRKDDLYSAQTIGLAIAAYERTLLANRAPYQEWLKGDNTALTSLQKEGMELFFNKASCYQCHNGPALNSEEFYALGLNELSGSDIIETSGAKGAALGRGGFTNIAEDHYKFKVPQLYNLKDAVFYGHGASFTSIRAFIEYMNEAEPENTSVPEAQLAAEFVPLALTTKEIDALTDFIENALYDAELHRHLPNSLPSGYCFPNNDPISKKQLCE